MDETEQSTKNMSLLILLLCATVQGRSANNDFSIKPLRHETVLLLQDADVTGQNNYALRPAIIEDTINEFGSIKQSRNKGSIDSYSNSGANALSVRDFILSTNLIEPDGDRHVHKDIINPEPVDFEKLSVMIGPHREYPQNNLPMIVSYDDNTENDISNTHSIIRNYDTLPLSNNFRSSSHKINLITQIIKDAIKNIHILGSNSVTPFRKVEMTPNYVMKTPAFLEKINKYRCQTPANDFSAGVNCNRGSSPKIIVRKGDISLPIDPCNVSSNTVPEKKQLHFVSNEHDGKDRSRAKIKKITKRDIHPRKRARMGLENKSLLSKFADFKGDIFDYIDLSRYQPNLGFTFELPKPGTGPDEFDPFRSPWDRFLRDNGFNLGLFSVSPSFVVLGTKGGPRPEDKVYSSLLSFHGTPNHGTLAVVKNLFEQKKDYLLNKHSYYPYPPTPAYPLPSPIPIVQSKSQFSPLSPIAMPALPPIQSAVQIAPPQIPLPNFQPGFLHDHSFYAPFSQPHFYQQPYPHDTTLTQYRTYMPPGYSSQYINYEPNKSNPLYVGDYIPSREHNFQYGSRTYDGKNLDYTPRSLEINDELPKASDKGIYANEYGHSQYNFNDHLSNLQADKKIRFPNNRR